MSVHDLPAVNATLNGTAGLFLLGGFVAIRRRNIPLHRAFMIAAAVTSALFLASYLYYHYHTGSTRFQTPGLIRAVYLGILLTHTVLAAGIAVMAPLTLWHAVRNRFDRHRRLARWTWPIWMTVSVTGVVIYFMLYHLDPRLSGA